MSSKAITEKREEQPPPGGWESRRETAPSVVREDEPKVARFVGMWGLMFVVLGVAAIILTASGLRGLIGYGLASVSIAVGVVGLLFHAALDRDLQVRRAYGMLGLGLLIVGAILPWLPFKGEVGGLFGFGYPCLVLALLFELAFLRHEEDTYWHGLAVNVIGGVGLALALVAFIGGNVSKDLLLPQGLLLGLLGLVYLCAFVSLKGAETDQGYWAGLALGAAGLLVFLVALGRSSLPRLFYTWGWLREPPAQYLVPYGICLMALGAAYIGCAVTLLSENRLVVMTRRELAAYFFSPIAYLVLFGMTLVASGSFFYFLTTVTKGQFTQTPFEPIVRPYFFNILPIFCLIFIVPVLTMRLLSEEKRTATLEVLLTAPVKESTVVLSKFIAALLFFLLTWVPWLLFLAALRVEGQQEFDYRPVLSFVIALTCMGVGFVGMGLFFSSLTRNQIASAVLTVAGMLLFTLVHFLQDWAAAQGTGLDKKESAWAVVLQHVSYIDLWRDSLKGALMPRLLVFHLSAGVLFVFLTIKVLESRKWS